MDKATLYILCGLPYSGKTTFTKELVKEFGVKVISMDDLMDRKGYKPETMTQKHWNEVYSEGYEKLKEYLSEGYSTILDLGNLKRSERNTAKEIAESLGALHKLIYINTPLEEIEARRSLNQQTRKRGHLEDEVMDSACSMFEEPESDENPIILTPQMDLQEWIKKTV